MLEVFLIFFTCIISSFLTGLLGIGGGLIIIPVFLSILPIFGINHYSIHQIVGISTASVFINSAVTVFYRRNEEFLKSSMIVWLAIAIIIGTVTGTYLSSGAAKSVILAIYIIVSIISFYLLKHDVFFDISKHKLSWLLYPIFSAIGAISASIGIGGAILFTVTLKSYISNNTKKLLPTVTLLVLIHALFAFSGKLILGCVPLKIIPIAFLASIIGSKIGVAVSKKLSANSINNALIGVMIFSLIRVILEFFSP